MRTKTQGFTLIELMIAVAVVAILAAIALPSYQDSVRKSRRADAHAALQAAQLAQEKYRLNNTTYFASTGNNFSGAAAEFSRVCAVGITSCTSTNGFYRLTSTVGASGLAATDYTVTATAIGSQAADTHCATISVAQTATAVTYSGTSTDCWSK